MKLLWQMTDCVCSNLLASLMYNVQSVAVDCRTTSHDVTHISDIECHVMSCHVVMIVSC